MILECKSCKKKFIVPDNAIPPSGRLVQCSSCGNKWTQFPQEKETKEKNKIISSKKVVEKKINVFSKKKKSSKKKSGPTIYSKEYLEQKHGIKIGSRESLIKKKGIKASSSEQSYFGFYTYLLIFIITILMLFGILNLTKEILIFYFPFLNPYIEILYENINNFKILLRDVFNFY